VLAVRFSGGVVYLNVGSESFVSLHESRHPTVRVTVREAGPADQSPYYAWWDSAERKFRYVWPSRAQVEMCFGDAQVAAREETLGHGRIVNVVVEERP